MASAVTDPSLGTAERTGWFQGIRAAERVAILFFLYLALLGMLRSATPAQRAAQWTMPFLIWVLCRFEHASSRPWSRVVREWLALGIILAGYWMLGWLASPTLTGWEATFESWDHTLLNRFGFEGAVESAGTFVPSVLEVVYLLLYTIPPCCLGVIYLCGARPAVYRFLFTLLLGTFATYALLPLFPMHSPRVVYPLQDLPHLPGLARPINTWLLDHLDISTSVFPSGHVAVAFSSAFGLLHALRERPRIWITFFIVATLVYVATIYGRYHYAVDGLVSIVISGFAWFVVGKWEAWNE